MYSNNFELQTVVRLMTSKVNIFWNVSFWSGNITAMLYLLQDFSSSDTYTISSASVKEVMKEDMSASGDFQCRSRSNYGTSSLLSYNKNLNYRKASSILFLIFNTLSSEHCCPRRWLSAHFSFFHSFIISWVCLWAHIALSACHPPGGGGGGGRRE